MNTVEDDDDDEFGQLIIEIFLIRKFSRFSSSNTLHRILK